MDNTLTTIVQNALARGLEWRGFMRDYEKMVDQLTESCRFAVAGMDIHTGPGIYQPGAASSTQFIINHLGLVLPPSGARMLELGCGAGALAILAARAGLVVRAGDIDPLAVRLTRDNAARNDAAVAASESDLFAAFAGERFDLILFNIPFFHTPQPISERERALADPEGSLVTRFLDVAHQHLLPGGRLAFTFANCSNPALLHRPDWSFEVAALDYSQRNNFIRMLISATPRQP